MPWKPADAQQKTRRADTPEKQRQWAEVANNVLERTGDDAAAVRAANSALKHHPAHKPAPRTKHWSGK